MALDVCIAAVMERFPELKKKRILEIAEIMDRRVEARERAGVLHDMAMKQVADEIAEDLQRAATQAKRHRLINMAVFARLSAYADDVAERTGSPWLAVEAAMVGVNAPIPGGRASVAANTKTLERTYLSNLYTRFRQEGLLDDMRLRSSRAGRSMNKFQRDVARELEALTKPGATRSDDPRARKAAEIIHEVRLLALKRENAAGGSIGILPGYITRVSHEQQRVRAVSEETWKADVLEHIDAEATFKGADPDEFLHATYEAIRTGIRLASHGAEEADTFFKFEGPHNLAKRAARHRVLQWKSADDWMAYHDKYGRGDLMENIGQDLRRHAQNTALMRTFGPNPRAMFERWITNLKRKYRDQPKIIEQLEKGIFPLSKRFGIFMDIIDGTVNIPGSLSLASLTQNIINLKSIASLGQAGISAMGDPIFRGAEARAFGHSFFKGVSDGILDAVRGFTGTDRKDIGELLHVGLETTMGDIISRFHSPDQIIGATTTMTRLFFKLNRLGPVTDAIKRGHARMLSLDLAKKAETSWEDLDELTRNWLERYDIFEAHWNVMRHMVTSAPDGRLAMLPDLARDLPDEIIAPLVDGDILSAAALANVRTELEINLSRLFTDRSEFASPTPGARERAFMLFGTQPGTPLGTALRLMMLFKGFPIAVMMRPLGQLIHGQINGRADIVGLIQLMTAGAAMGYGIMVAKSLASGKTPPDPANPEVWAEAFLQGGTGGLYADFLFSEHNRYGRGLIQDLAGPTFADVQTLSQVFAGAARGENRFAQLLSLLWRNVPGNNLIFTKAVTDYFIYYNMMEAINPGTLRRLERRIKKEKGQTFFFPPSEQ